jgi:hypothetical protein
MESDSVLAMQSGSVISQADGLGAINANTGLTLVESGNGIIQKTVFTMTATPITIAEGSNAEFVGIKIYDFPGGAIQILGATLDLVVTASGITDKPGDVSLATVVIDDSTMGAADANQKDILAATAFSAVVSGVGPIQGQGGARTTPLDGTGTAKDMYFNFTLDNGATAGTAVLTGTITVHWMIMGDYT